ILHNLVNNQYDQYCRPGHLARELHCPLGQNGHEPEISHRQRHTANPGRMKRDGVSHSHRCGVINSPAGLTKTDCSRQSIQ
ncbi:unnamed protein product, partial [Coregonus sp. 'balchen']